MNAIAPIRIHKPPALRRLMAIADLDDKAIEAVMSAIRQSRDVPARGELLHEGKPITETLLIVSGWAARLRQFEDGRRQIMSFLVPGDLIGNCHQGEPIAVSNVVALTEIEVCAAPSGCDYPCLKEAYAVSSALEEAFLLAHITRLGRMNAEERLADLLLELYERLTLCGLAANNSFRLPLTQEMFADALGLSSVHINRTLQNLRQDEIILKGGVLTFSDPEALAEKLSRAPVRVTGARP